jgi:hypothetical protein
MKLQHIPSSKKKNVSLFLYLCFFYGSRFFLNKIRARYKLQAVLDYLFDKVTTPKCDTFF